MEIKKSTLFPKIISFMRIEKDVLIFLIIGFFICYIIPLALVLTVPTKDLLRLIIILSRMFALKVFIPTLFIFILNKIIFIQKKEKIIKWLEIIKKTLYVFYLVYWGLIILALIAFLFG